MQPPIFVSFYTPHYIIGALDLEESLKAHNLEYDIQEIEDKGSWLNNVHYKPEFILKMLDVHKGRPVVWLDADMQVLRFPSLLLDISADIGIFYRKSTQKDKWVIGSGTVWVSNSDAGRNLMNLWIEQIRMSPGLPADPPLAKVLGEHPEFRVFSLPPAYCFVYDLSRELYPDVEPVILARQFSRAIRDLHS